MLSIDNSTSSSEMNKDRILLNFLDPTLWVYSFAVGLTTSKTIGVLSFHEFDFQNYAPFVVCELKI